MKNWLNKKFWLIGILCLLLVGCSTLPEVDSTEARIDSETIGTSDDELFGNVTDEDVADESTIKGNSVSNDSLENDLKTTPDKELSVQNADAQIGTGSSGTYDMTVHFLDVGQGLSVLVQSGDEVLIYDGGDRDTSSYVVSYLKDLGIKTIDYLISSHYDSDHVYGLIGCLNAFEVENVISSDYVHESQTYEKFVTAVKNEGLEMLHPTVGTKYNFGTGSFTILAPKTFKENGTNENSVVIKLENGDNSFIFTGDAEHSSEANMVSSGIDLECDVLCVGHHGSATGTSWDFLQATVPEYAIISCGVDNKYGHPDADVMEKLESMEIEVFRTDMQGTIVASSDGSVLTWNVQPCNDYSSGDEESTISTTVENTGNDAGDSVSKPANSQSSVQKSNNEELVWITPTGGKYHSINNCGKMNPDKASQITKEEAEGRGLEACSKCY